MLHNGIRLSSPATLRIPLPATIPHSGLPIREMFNVQDQKVDQTFLLSSTRKDTKIN